MNSTIYNVIKEFVKSDKDVVVYIYIVYNLYKKYGHSIFKSIDKIKEIDNKLWEILCFVNEKNYSLSFVYKLLIYSKETANYNIVEVEKWSNVQASDIEKFLSTNLKTDYETITKDVKHIWFRVKTIDSMIYKRFFINDLKKSLNI